MGAISWLFRREAMALGLTLLHFCWQGTVLALVYAIVDRIASRATSAVRYAVALGALASMPLFMMITFAAEIQVLPTTVMNTTRAVGAVSPAYLDGLQEPTTHDSSVAFVPLINHHSAWLGSHVERVLPWVDAVWMVGVLFLALRAMGGWWQLERVRQRARQLVPDEVARQFEWTCERTRVGRQIALRISDEVISPLAMGLWRATVILPASAVLRMPASELEAVLAHELGHIRRWDYLCNLLQTAIESVLFFHPAVWWLSRTVRERREVCCDEIAVCVCADPVVYAQALLHLEEDKTAKLSLAMALKGSEGLLLRRVTQVLGSKGNLDHRMTGGVRVAVACLMVALMFGPKVLGVIAAPVTAVSRAVFTHNASDALPTTTPRVAVAPTKRTRSKTEPASAHKADLKPSGLTLSQSAMPAKPSDVALTAISAHGAGLQAADGASSTKDSTYLDEMRAAGYPMDLNTDLNTLMNLKWLGVTAEYAKSMAAVGLGKPTVHDLMNLNSLGVTPNFVSSLKQEGLLPETFSEVVTEKSLGMTPEYVAAMKQAGFNHLDMNKLMMLKAQGATPEYALWLRQRFPEITVEQLERAAVFHIDERFLTQVKAHGFEGVDIEKLLRIKMSGLFNE